MRILSLLLALPLANKTIIGYGFVLVAVGVAIILASSVFTMLLPSLLPNQQSAFATFPGENGLIAFSGTTDGPTPAGIYVINSDGTSQTRINAEKGYGSGSIAPAWSPDGSKIAFTRYDEFGTVSNVNVMNYDGNNQIALTNYPIDSHIYNIMGSWSPDGSKIAFTSTRVGAQSDIYVMNAADGGQVQRLTTNTSEDQYPDWSPDGSKIVFESNRDGNFEIYLMNPEGTSQTRLTNTNEHEDLPSWSPDGSKMVFQSGPNPDIYIMNADTTGRKQLTSMGAEHPAWSPQGDKIAFRRDREIYVMDAADGSNQVRLTGEQLINEALPDWGTQTALPPPEEDTTPPVLTVPEDMVVEATSEQGAEVTYTVTAQDDVDGNATLEEDGTTVTQDNVGGDIDISCEPASGTTFPIGNTTVQCSATDEASNTGTESFTVTVNPPSPSPPTPTPKQIIDRLISTVENLDDNVPQSVKTSLIAALKQVSNILSDNNPNNDESACSRFGAFINQINANERRDTLTADQADELRTQAEEIRDLFLGC
jgi:Tol biopolymer transport system component